MKLRVFQDTLCNGIWTGVGIGDFDPVTAENLIRAGVAEAYETKVIERMETKIEPIDEKKSLSVSPPAPALQKRTYRKSKDRA